MVHKSMVDFHEKVGPIFRRYADTYGVRNTCSLGVLLVDRLTPRTREALMGMIAGDTAIEEIVRCIQDRDQRRAAVVDDVKKAAPRRLYGKPKTIKKE